MQLLRLIAILSLVLAPLGVALHEHADQAVGQDACAVCLAKHHYSASDVQGQESVLFNVLLFFLSLSDSSFVLEEHSSFYHLRAPPVFRNVLR